jgi:hypothetical protein
VIGTFTGPGLQRITTRDHNSGGRPQWIEYRLGQRGRPNVGSERLPVDENVNAARCLVRLDADSISCGVYFRESAGEQERDAKQDGGNYSGSKNAHIFMRLS